MVPIPREELRPGYWLLAALLGLPRNLHRVPVEDVVFLAVGSFVVDFLDRSVDEALLAATAAMKRGFVLGEAVRAVDQ